MNRTTKPTKKSPIKSTKPPKSVKPVKSSQLRLRKQPKRNFSDAPKSKIPTYGRFRVDGVEDDDGHPQAQPRSHTLTSREMVAEKEHDFELNKKIVAPHELDVPSRKLQAEQQRTSVSNKSPKESLASTEYSAITKVRKYPILNNSQASHLELDAPQDVVDGQHVDKLCSEKMKIASQYGSQYEDEAMCDFPNTPSRLSRSTTGTKRQFHTIVSSRRNYTISLRNFHAGNSNSDSSNSAEKKPSPFEDPVFYSSYNIIGDTRPGWKTESEISQQFSDNPEQLEKARERVAKFKINIPAQSVASIDKCDSLGAKAQKTSGSGSERTHENHDNSRSYTYLDPLLYYNCSPDEINIGSEVHASSLATASTAIPLAAETVKKMKQQNAGLTGTGHNDAGPLTTSKRPIVIPANSTRDHQNVILPHETEFLKF